jgi:disulfide bond formation protein DsbB
MMQSHQAASATVRSVIIPLFVALCAASILAGALWVQHEGNPPCPLCILQRIAYLALLAFALIAAGLSAARQTISSRMALMFGALSGLIGLGIAARHIWLVLHPGQTCGLDPLAVTINHWSITHWMPWMFSADGLCADVPDVFGLSLPMWSALGFTLLTALLLLPLRSPKRQQGQ